MERLERVVLDTHTFVWWISTPELLSGAARKAIDAAAGGSVMYVSAISVWEIALLANRGRLRLTLEVADWIARCEGLPFLNFVPVDNLVALKANELADYANRDPADRMIIATALLLNATVITKDTGILAYRHVRSRW